MKDNMLRVSIVIRKGAQIIHRTSAFMTIEQFQDLNPSLQLELRPIEENGCLICKIVSVTIEKKIGIYAGVLTTTYVDRKAMEAKVCELEALLDEYGARLNGNKHKYDAHLLSISEKKFTTSITEEVEVSLDIRQILTNR